MIAEVLIEAGSVQEVGMGQLMPMPGKNVSRALMPISPEPAAKIAWADIIFGFQNGFATFTKAGGGGVRLPFLADDLFINFDDDRANAGFKVLAEVAKTTKCYSSPIISTFCRLLEVPSPPTHSQNAQYQCDFALSALCKIDSSYRHNFCVKRTTMPIDQELLTFAATRKPWQRDSLRRI